METGQVEDLAVWILGQVTSAESSRDHLVELKQEIILTLVFL